MSEVTIFDHLETHKQQHPDIAETMLAYREVAQIYREAIQVMREAELALCHYTISISTSTIANKQKEQQG